jgi:hypothetical protein
MSVRVDGGERGSQGTAIPAATAFTMGGWVKRLGVVGTFDCAMALEQAGGADGFWIGFQGGSFYYYTGATNAAFPSGSIYNAAWSYVAFSINGTVGTVYARLEGETILQAVGSISVTSFTAATLWFASDSGPEDFNGEMVYGRAWGAVKSAAQLQAESESPTMVDTSGVYGNYPFAAAASIGTDDSGQGHNLAWTGSAADGASMPVITTAFAPVGQRAQGAIARQQRYPRR